ncbi:MAG: GSCFA domain-containing protein [Bacteroidia bacterium]|jgi:GSCFA family|nr:GSCFA domain-containing protein [Bacteroidia bacterium]
MQFHLNYKPKPSLIKIDHQQKLMLVGSCFSENIGIALQKHHFNCLVNPNGILFNPQSIHQSLLHCLENSSDIASHIHEREGLHFSFLHHSSISENSEQKLKALITKKQQEAHDHLKVTDVLVLTFGTAYTYFHKTQNITVANCHKHPGTIFEKKLLSVEEIVNDYSNLIDKLKSFNPKLKFIFTVSPVKYLKDGVEENNLSKATLLLAISELKKKFEIDYFPAYELVIDDLRDYRFYKEDLAHPNDAAIKYVWEKFSDTYFTEETKKLNSELHSINASEDHKILFPESDEAKKFKETVEHKKRELKAKFSFLKF